MGTIRGGQIIVTKRLSAPINVAVGTIEVDLFNLSVAGKEYVLEGFFLKFPNPGMNSITVNLYSLSDNVETKYGEYLVNANNYQISRTMMDIFGLASLASTLIKLKAIAIGGTHTITGQYGYLESK